MADAKKYELLDTAQLTIQNKKGDDDLIGDDDTNPVVFTIFSPGSKQGVRALHKAGQAAQLRLQGLMRGRTDKDAAQQADKEQAEKLASVVESVSNFSTPGTALDIFSNPKLRYITAQVEAFFSDNGNF